MSMLQRVRTVTFLPATKPAGQWITIGLLELLEIVALRSQRDMVTYVIEVTDFDSKVISDLQGRLEPTMASEATKMAVR